MRTTKIRRYIDNHHHHYQYIDLAKPKSGAPWLFILTACRVCENKRFQIVRVLMFPVAALIIISFSLLSSIEKFIA